MTRDEAAAVAAARDALQAALIQLEDAERKAQAAGMANAALVRHVWAGLKDVIGACGPDFLAAAEVLRGE